MNPEDAGEDEEDGRSDDGRDGRREIMADESFR
jgi:hypothetical protein